jgi:hypothetical protein
MKWDAVAFVGFIGLGAAGAVAGCLVLLLRRKLFGLGRREVSVVAFGTIVGVGICIAGIASAIVSMLPRLFGPQSLGPTETILEHVQWRLVVAFVSMLSGMAASYLNKLINERRAKIEKLRRKGDLSKPGLDFDLWDFLQPFVVSLITFGAIAARGNGSDVVTNILLGFQTGFFWQTVLSHQSHLRQNAPGKMPSSTRAL